MSTDRQRDADLDRMLRATLGQKTASSADACPDAGMLASLVEDGLSADERTVLESHLAACGRCRDILAAMDLDVPAPAAAAPATRPNRSWLWRGHLHWLIPVTAASVLVIYLASRTAIAPYFPPVTPESTQVAAVPSEARPAAPVPTQMASPGSGAETREKGAAPAQAGDLRRKGPATVGAGATRADETGQPARMAASAPAPAPDLTPGKREPAGVAAEPAAGIAANVTARLDRDTKAVKPAAGPVAAPQPAAFAPAQTVPTVQPAAVAPPTPAAPAVGAAGAGADAAKLAAADAAREAQAPMAMREQALRSAPPSVVEVAARGGAVAWRVGPGGAIWRSADSGRTWYPQKSGVTAALLAAAAPSVTTCWAVGTAGTVLLTDDGERWERRHFPEPVDLIAVEARSSREATVTTRDGRRFTTTDRGATWTSKRD